MNIIFILILAISGIYCQKKDSVKIQSVYASSLFRQNQILEGVPIIESLENVSSVSICLLNCIKRKPECKAFNWGNTECTLMSDSICANETLILTPKSGFSYYDLMDSPESERKHLKDQYCRQIGKCSDKCYPRKPHYNNTVMTWSEAHKFCDGLGRTLPQPRSSEENSFYTNFIKKMLEEKPEIRNNKDMKFWVGLSDSEVEGVWMYVDNTPVLDSFSAWALGQPDNGGPFAKGKEDCAAIGEKADFKWVDINCNLKLKFFCA